MTTPRKSPKKGTSGTSNGSPLKSPSKSDAGESDVYDSGDEKPEELQEAAEDGEEEEEDDDDDDEPGTAFLVEGDLADEEDEDDEFVPPETTADLEEGEEADNGQSDLSHAAVPTPVDPNTPIRNRTRAFKRAREDDGKAADGLKSPPAKRAANIDAEKTT